MLRKQNFEQYLNEATDNYRLETDWDLIMKLCDLIRQGDVKPSHALNAIQKKICSPNSVVALYGLTVLESCVKNCGALIQDEVSTKQFMETFKDIIKSCPNENVRTKCLDLLQSWAFAFRNAPKHRAVQDTVTIMKTEGYKFPTFKESDAMFSADTAPSWKDGECCHRCRTAFTLINRKHHCRACGEVFCQQCSSHSITLPKFGIEKQVRVCDTCLEKCHKPSGTFKIEDPSNDYVGTAGALSNQQCTPNKKTDEELKEEEELQLAIALSQSEAESKRSSYKPVVRSKSFSPPVAHKTNHPENDDVELSRYLNRSYWENRAVSSEKIRDLEEPTMEKKLTTTTIHDIDSLRVERKEEYIGDESDCEIELFVNALRNQVEILVNRMKSNSSRGRSIANDTSVQTLFLNMTTMHSRLLKYIQLQDDSRVYYEGLQDKLTQVKDARAALNALREEHRERLRREAEIAERQRQIQMAQKLEIMRQKKQEYLQYQRQLALKRIHDQERELHMRQEQQMQQYRLSNAYGSLPYIAPPQGGGISAFEPVTSLTMNMNMNRNMNTIPSASASIGPFAPPQPSPSYGAHYVLGQNVSPAMPSQQQNTSTNVYMPVNHSSSGPLPPQSQSQSQSQPQPQPLPQSSSSSGAAVATSSNTTVPNQLTTLSQSTAQYAASQPMLHSGCNVNMHVPPQSQALFVDSQNVSAMTAVHIDQNTHVIANTQPASARSEHTAHLIASSSSSSSSPSLQNVNQAMSNSSMIQHPNVGRSMIPPSSSPLSSPSSSSEHSLVQHGPQPTPSAPSATSTPQPEEKEEIAELISFD